MTMTKIAALACLCGVAAITPNMKADAFDKKTVFTFSAPVEIPGQVLPEGTYVFKLILSASSRSIVRVLDKDETRVIGTFLTIPDYRMTPAEKPLVRFAERPAGSAPAIKSWFYPGESYGNEFVYPKTRALALAKASHQNVPAMPSNLASNTTEATADESDPTLEQMEVADLKAEEPSGAEVDLAAVFLMAPRPATASLTDLPNELPETASPLPLLACIGLLSLAAGIAVRKAAQQLN